MWWTVSKWHGDETLAVFQGRPLNGLPVLRKLVLVLTVAGRQAWNIPWIGGYFHCPFRDLIEGYKLIVGNGPTEFLMKPLTRREVLSTESRHCAGPLIRQTAKRVIIIQVSLR